MQSITRNDNPDPHEIMATLRKLRKTQAYLAKQLKRPQSQVSMAINRKGYPTLRKRIVNHIIKLETLL